MREIKFRAWINEWRWNLYTPTWEDQQKEDASWMQYFKENKIEPCNDDYILMQYTGLKDKNGKEIYEGDIVDSWANFDEKYIRTIIYDKEECRFKCSPSTWTMLCKGSTDNWTFEIIWNIYENPDLLNNK